MFEQQSYSEENYSFNIPVQITFHPDKPGNSESNRGVYAILQKAGIHRFRYDYRWSLVQPESGGFNQKQLQHYTQERSNMRKSGLDEPTIILSSIPPWATSLYKRGNKEDFFNAYRNYTKQVRQALKNSDEGSRISRIQVLNEVNFPAYTPIEISDVDAVNRITRETFTNYNPEVQIINSILATTLPPGAEKLGVPENIRQFLPKLERIKDSVDIISIDYYPGSWYRPITLINFMNRIIFPGKEAYKSMFHEMDLFIFVAEQVASWGKDYEIGETGFPTKGIYWGNDRRQCYFYNILFWQLRHLMIKFYDRDMPLPSTIGLYEVTNEPPQDWRGKVLRAITPYPECDWGILNDSGKPKEIFVKLSDIIRYFHAEIRRRQHYQGTTENRVN